MFDIKVRVGGLPVAKAARRSGWSQTGAPGPEGQGFSVTALEATQGQMNDFLSQLPCTCKLEQVASVGN